MLSFSLDIHGSFNLNSIETSNRLQSVYCLKITRCFNTCENKQCKRSIMTKDNILMRDITSCILFMYNEKLLFQFDVIFICVWYDIEGYLRYFAIVFCSISYSCMFEENFHSLLIYYDMKLTYVINKLHIFDRRQSFFF